MTDDLAARFEAIAEQRKAFEAELSRAFNEQINRLCEERGMTREEFDEFAAEFFAAKTNPGGRS